MTARRLFSVLSLMLLWSIFLAPAGAQAEAGSWAWNTFLGGRYHDWSGDIALSGNGDIYIVGSSDNSWGAPLDPYAGCCNPDIFVAKVDSSGALLWNTFLGTTEADNGEAIAVDEVGNIYITGHSAASWGSPVNPFAGGVWDAFVAKLDTNGSLLWNTFLGGDDYDWGSDIAPGGDGQIYVAGSSESGWGTPASAFVGGSDAFVARLDGMRGTLVWNTFFGGVSIDQGTGIAMDPAGNLYAAGISWASWGNPVRAYTGKDDAFAVRLDPNGKPIWNTFLGGGESDSGYGIAVAASGNVYLAGYSSANWGTPLRPYAGGYDAFVAGMDGMGSLRWNTFLGGPLCDGANGIALDATEELYVAGSSCASWGRPLHSFAGNSDAFLARLHSSGSLTWNMFQGGMENDTGDALALDSHGNLYSTGESNGSWGSPVAPYSDLNDVFVASLGNAVGFRSTAALDGWVLESSETSGRGGTLNAGSTTFSLGDSAEDQQYRAILSFNTMELPDNADITKATLLIKKQRLVGTNPFTTHGGLKADIRAPYFGGSMDLGLGDFRALASQNAAAAFDPKPATGGWYSAILGPAAYPYINLTGTTQFRLRFGRDDNDNMTADFLKFFSGNARDNYRPVLLIEYIVP